MRRTCGCPWLACRVDIEVILDAAEAGRPDGVSPPAGSWRPRPRHRGGPLGAASVMARRSEGARRTHHRGGRPTAVNRQVMNPKFLLSFPWLEPSLPESPGGQREAVPAGHG